MRAIIDGAVIADRAALHDEFAASLELPHWYGRNLDALFDLLTEPDMSAEIELRNFSELREKLGRYADSLAAMLRRARAENPALELIFEAE